MQIFFFFQILNLQILKKSYVDLIHVLPINVLLPTLDSQLHIQIHIFLMFPTFYSKTQKWNLTSLNLSISLVLTCTWGLVEVDGGCKCVFCCSGCVIIIPLSSHEPSMWELSHIHSRTQTSKKCFEQLKNLTNPIH